MSAPLAVLRDGTEVAAWVFKANPDPRFRRPEVVRSARLGSPLALTRDELGAVEDAIGAGRTRSGGRRSR